MAPLSRTLPRTLWAVPIGTPRLQFNKMALSEPCTLQQENSPGNGLCLKREPLQHSGPKRPGPKRNPCLWADSRYHMPVVSTALLPLHKPPYSWVIWLGTHTLASHCSWTHKLKNIYINTKRRGEALWAIVVWKAFIQKCMNNNSYHVLSIYCYRCYAWLMSVLSNYLFTTTLKQNHCSQSYQ